MTKVLVRSFDKMALKGKGAVARQDAFIAIAPLAYSEGMSRAAIVDKVRTALGKSPTDAERAMAKQEYIVGRMTARLPSAEFPKGMADAADRLAHCRSLVTEYAAPPKDGVAARPLRKGQKGRRTIAQQRAFRAGEEAWSQVLAECGIGSAQSQGERNKAKRVPAAAGSTKRGKAGKATPPTHSALVTPPAPTTADDACQHLVAQLAALVAYSKKHGGLIPSGMQAAILACHKTLAADDATRRSLATVK